MQVLNSCKKVINQSTKSNVRLLFIYCIALILFSSGKQDSNIQKVLSISDIHFSPFHDQETVKQLIETPYPLWDTVFQHINDPQLATYGEETSPLFLKALLKDMQRWEADISSVLFSGDMLAHEFNQHYATYSCSWSQADLNEFIYKTVGYLSMTLRNAFPDKPIYFTLGNNDSYAGDYALIDGGQFLNNTAMLFFTNFLQPGIPEYTDLSNTYFKQYPQNGYYSVDAEIFENARIIGLNSVYFSTSYVSNSSESDPGMDELDWLEAELRQASVDNKKVWIIQHIPPGVNVYATAHNSTPNNIQVEMMWQDKYNNRYLSLIRKYQSVIAATFAGHTHMDDFRLIRSVDKNGHMAFNYIHITPSVSPVFDNNPSYQLISYNANTGVLTDATTYYYNISEQNPTDKKEYTYTSTYKTLPNLKGLAYLYPEFLQDSAKLADYIKYYPSSSTEVNIANDWKWYWCGIGNLTEKEYKQAYMKLVSKNDINEANR